ncbi:hypothetical protein Z947_1579 [Sulfitobacter geojensis]|nr:hypothetical protein Z947_1579 [Sulfitobacter geojensis]
MNFFPVAFADWELDAHKCATQRGCSRSSIRAAHLPILLTLERASRALLPAPVVNYGHNGIFIRTAETSIKRLEVRKARAQMA